MFEHFWIVAIITASSGVIASLYGAWIRISLTRTIRIAVRAKPKGLKSMQVHLGFKPSMTVKWDTTAEATQATDEEPRPRSLSERRRSA